MGVSLVPKREAATSSECSRVILQISADLVNPQLASRTNFCAGFNRGEGRRCRNYQRFLLLMHQIRRLCKGELISITVRDLIRSKWGRSRNSTKSQQTGKQNSFPIQFPWKFEWFELDSRRPEWSFRCLPSFALHCSEILKSAAVSPNCFLYFLLNCRASNYQQVFLVVVLHLFIAKLYLVYCMKSRLLAAEMHIVCCWSMHGLQHISCVILLLKAIINLIYR